MRLDLSDPTVEEVNETVVGATDMEATDMIGDGAEEGDIDLSDYQLAEDRTRRQAKPPNRFKDYECDAADGEDIYARYICDMSEDTTAEPSSWKKEMEDPDSDIRTEAATEEMSFLKRNSTWILVDKPKDLKTIGCRWVFKRMA